LVRVPLSAKEPIDVLQAKLAESSIEVLIAPPEVLDGVASWLRGIRCAGLAVAGQSQYPRYEGVVAGAAAPALAGLTRPSWPRRRRVPQAA
jgi:hypothetical protein